MRPGPHPEVPSLSKGASAGRSWRSALSRSSVRPARASAPTHTALTVSPGRLRAASVTAGETSRPTGGVGVSVSQRLPCKPPTCPQRPGSVPLSKGQAQGAWEDLRAHQQACRRVGSPRHDRSCRQHSSSVRPRPSCLGVCRAVSRGGASPAGPKGRRACHPLRKTGVPPWGLPQLRHTPRAGGGRGLH